MTTLLSHKEHTAQKDYHCDASLFITECGRPDFFKTISDYRNYIIAKSKGFKILKGEKYYRQSGIFEGEFYCSKMIPEMHNLCVKYISLYAGHFS